MREVDNIASNESAHPYGGDRGPEEGSQLPDLPTHVGYRRTEALVPPSVATAIALTLGAQVQGQGFFEVLDIHLRCAAIADSLLRIVEPISSPYIVVTGDFGKFIARHLISTKRAGHLLWLPGGLGSGAGSIPRFRAPQIQGKNVVVLDDTFYSGQTFDHIAAEVDRWEPRSIHAVVAYDGCPEKRDDVFGLFRYHSVAGKKLFLNLQRIHNANPRRNPANLL